jgi:tetratricopeptide (TPR) repeat protein
VISLRRLANGDLNSITLKALEKVRARRYASVADLADDIQRYMEDRPVLASRAGSLYRARKFFRRHKFATLGTAAAFVILALSGLTLWSFSQRAVATKPVLMDKDGIVLADFDNKTGDPVFDDTLRQGLAVELQQSPFLSLISDGQVQRQLALMGQPKDARLTPEIAKQICERTASAAVLEGSIASLGSQYVLGLRAKNCQTGSILDQEQAVAPKSEDVLNSLSEMSRKFRTRVGESLATVERHSTPLPEATTRSIEALKAYSTARVGSGNTEAGLPFMRRAVEIDPTFAMAYAQLGLMYSALGESVLAAENTTKAWRLRDRVSERERFFIDFTYDRDVTGNLEQAYQTLESWFRTYPRGENPSAHGLLGGSISLRATGRFDRAIEMGHQRIALAPDEAIGYSNLASSYYFLGRFAEAESTLHRGSERKLETPASLALGYNMAVLKGDQEQMDRAIRLARGKPQVEHLMAHQEALALARSGRLQAARRSSSRAVDLALQERRREAAATYQGARAVWEAVCGNAGEGQKSATAALDLSKGREVQYAAGLALALSGGFARSEVLAEDLEKRFPEDTFVKFTYAPVLRALAALGRGQPADSVGRLQIALRYELAATGLDFSRYLGGLHSAYVRGEALMAAHQYAEAAAEFQKILDHPGILSTDPIGALARLQLGRVFARSGDKTKAKAAYQDFFVMWKDADPDIPILKQAKAEYERL